MTNIHSIVRKVKQLSPIPSVVHKILALSHDAEASFSPLIRLVEHDQTITANLLKVCNSAYFGLSVRIDSVQQAVSMLGIQRVIELVMSQNLSAELKKGLKGYRLGKGDLWKQSVSAAQVARTLGERRELFNLPAIYTAALLKDIGKVILHDYVDHAFDKIQHLVEKKGISFIEAEHECIGIDHAKLGGIIAKEWNFSQHMVFMIENHHLTQPEARNDPATETLYLADMVAMMVGTGIGVDRLAYQVYESIFEDFFLAREELKELMILYKRYFTDAQNLLEG